MTRIVCELQFSFTLDRHLKFAFVHPSLKLITTASIFIFNLLTQPGLSPEAKLNVTSATFIPGARKPPRIRSGRGF